MLKPIDIHNAEFKRSFKGYNEEEVDAFLAKIVGEYESVIKENQQLRQQLKELEDSNQKLGSREQDVYHLISLTKETVEEAKEVARSQAEQVVAEAERKAKAILAETEAKEKEYQRRISEMARQEREFKERMRELMESVWRQIEASKAAPEVQSAQQDQADGASTGYNSDDTVRSTRSFQAESGSYSGEGEGGQTRVYRGSPGGSIDE